MNKHYDKLLLLLAVCALGAGAVLYVKQSGPDASRARGLGEGHYQAVAIPQMELADVSWGTPTPQEPSGFKYDVFTPYKIYIDPQTGEFTQDRPKDPLDGPEFIWDAVLLSISREPYRIQLEGFIDEGEGSVLFLFHDVELRKTVRARLGKDSAGAAASQFKVVDAQVKLLEGEDGSRTRLATATILDERTGEEKSLIHRELLFEDAVTVVVGSNRDGSFERELSEVGESFTTEYGSYTLKEINLEDSTITVEKAATADFEAESRKLLIDAPKADEATTIETDFADPSTTPDTVFDLFFQ